MISGWLLLGLGFHVAVLAEQLQSEDLSPIPMPLTNNAVTAVTIAGTDFVISFGGLASGKTHADTLDATWVLDVSTGQWSKASPLPGGVGRLASTAAAVGRFAYVFGGYSVAEDGTEVSTPWVHAFDAASGEFSERQAMPVPVDDAVALSYKDRYVYLLSGWHDYGNVNLVQRYDSETDSWVQATPIPGEAVFGHSGGIVGNKVFYCDGVAIRPNLDRARDFVASEACFLGLIDADDSRRIDWRKVSQHPGPPRYRMAAAGVPGLNAVLFIGGSDNPYNFNGVGYDGNPSQPRSGALLFDLDSLSWRLPGQTNKPSMDHRALVPGGDGWLTIGGMLAGQNVTNRVTLYRFEE